MDELQLITRKSKGMNSIGSLQGKRMSLLSNDDFTEFHLGTLVSQISKKEISLFFSDIDKQRKSQRLIFNLFFNQTDAILVYSSQISLAIEMNPQLGKAFQVIKRLGNIPRGIGFFHKDVSEKMREYFILEVLKFQDSVRGRQLLDILKADQFKRSYLSDLQSVNDLYFDGRRTK